MLCAHSATAILCWSLSKSNRLDPTNATFSSAAAGLKQPAGLWGMPTESTLTAGETVMVLVLSSQALRYIVACSITNRLWWDRPHGEALLPLCLWCAKSEQERMSQASTVVLAAAGLTQPIVTRDHNCCSFRIKLLGIPSVKTGDGMSSGCLRTWAR